MYLITMHNSYVNVSIISEVIYCSMYKNAILKKTPINIFLAFFLLHKLKIRYCASVREFELFGTK